MKVLITGGAGFIGSYLAKRLLDSGQEVVIVDSFAPQIHGDNLTVGVGVDARADLLRGDVRDVAMLKAALKDVDAVVHLAAETGTGQSMYEVARYTDVNAMGTATLLQLVAAGGLPRLSKLVVASSRAIYGEGRYSCAQHGVIYPQARSSQSMARGDFDLHCPMCDAVLTAEATDEPTPPASLSIYGLTKYFQEQAVLTVARASGLSAYALRYQNVYGPGQSLKNPYTGILAIFSNQARANAPIYVFEDGLESRDFVYIEDVVEATCRCLDPKHIEVDTFNVGTGTPTTVLEVAQSIVQLFDSSSSVAVNGAYRTGDIRHNFADTSKIQRTLGFRARRDFSSGLRNFVSWVKEQPLESSSAQQYEKSLQELRSRGLMRD